MLVAQIVSRFNKKSYLEIKSIAELAVVFIDDILQSAALYACLS